MTKSMKKIVGVVLILSLFLLLSNSVFANHPYSPKRHLTGLHSNTQYEFFCVDVSDISITTSAAYTQMKTDLYYKNYDGLAGGKVDWIAGGSSNTDCKDIGATALSTIQYRYYIQTLSTTGPSPSPCGGAYNCVARFGYTLSGGHSHYDYGTLTFRLVSYNAIREGIINHETGHQLGMIDGEEATCPTPSSIMHYACNYVGPSAADLATVTLEANS